MIVETVTIDEPREPLPSPAPLTPRENQIAQAIANGRSNRDIASQLGITEQTVKNHLTNIFGKVGVGSRLQLALALVKRS
jgi:two-component system nitrate/nitrite response regulator NarL